jgi:hypothetical protein
MIRNERLSRFYTLRAILNGHPRLTRSRFTEVFVEKHLSRLFKTVSERSDFITSISRHILSVAVSMLVLAQPALADRKHLYVDATATENGDGSRHRPFWRISDAVVRARELRQEDPRHEGRIVIRVLPGAYTGSYDASHLARNPRLELLPIIVNVSNLSLEGATELDEDTDSLPTGTFPPESETFLTTDLPLTRGQVLLLIASTTDGMAGDRVSVSGLVLDAQDQDLGAPGGFLIFADRVSEFSIHNNLTRRGNGVGSRLASGAFEANFCTANNPHPPPGTLGSAGIFFTGGSIVHPATVTLRRNRSIRNAGGASVDAVANFLQLDLGANALRLEPLQLTYDANNPDDQENIPHTLVATIEDNDFSDNTFFGLRLGFFPPTYYSTVNATQPITGTLSVTVHGNRINSNGQWYGITVDAFSSFRSNPRQLTGTFEGMFEDNSLVGNGRNAFVFSFTNTAASMCL